ncbi:MAG: hypothetical protein Q8K86_11640 [Candidatus Nanopelagicaceae bacterium]|nr:hypothetical protein [Candidatus Nanopelagicaceae bacterium]
MIDLPPDAVLLRRLKPSGKLSQIEGTPVPSPLYDVLTLDGTDVNTGQKADAHTLRNIAWSLEAKRRAFKRGCGK